MVRLWDCHCCNSSNNNQLQKQKIKQKNIQNVRLLFVIFVIIVWCLFFCYCCCCNYYCCSHYCLSLFSHHGFVWFLDFLSGTNFLCNRYWGSSTWKLFISPHHFFNPVPQLMVTANCTVHVHTGNCSISCRNLLVPLVLLIVIS